MKEKSEMPGAIIVSTRPAVMKFERELRHIKGTDVDIKEVFARIIAVCNLGEKCEDQMKSMSLMYSCIGLGVRIQDEKLLADGVLLSIAVMNLGLAVLAEIKALGLYKAESTLGYFYSDLLGKDLVLAKLPY
jgi:hypothetical protein